VGFFVRPFSAVPRHHQARPEHGVMSGRSTYSWEVTQMPRTRPESL
jgi:hypothetical protein